jgi:hypothetical protein
MAGRPSATREAAIEKRVERCAVKKRPAKAFERTFVVAIRRPLQPKRVHSKQKVEP